MKINLSRIMILFCLLLLTSCDPPHYINFVNNSNANAKIKLNINPDTEFYTLNHLSNGRDSIVFNLKQEEIVDIHFGIGTWSDWEIDEVTKSIKSIEIETSDITTIYKTKNAIKNLMTKNLQGLFMKNEILIEIK